MFCMYKDVKSNKMFEQFLDELITECSQEIDVKIPELGEHYSFQWNDNTINHEQQVGNVPKSMKLKNSTYNNDMKKNGLNMYVKL